MTTNIADKLAKTWLIIERTILIFSAFLMFISTIVVNTEYKSVVKENTQLKQEYERLVNGGPNER